MAQGRSSRIGAAAWLALLLGGCSGTAFGDRLAGSFSAPPAPAAPPAVPALPSAANSNASTVAAQQAGSANKAAAAAKGSEAKPTKPVRNGARQTVLPPAPYRITIKLPSADPSAPAEVVTEALRQAGVPFEVEMIERVNANAAAGAPTPAPAPRAR